MGKIVFIGDSVTKGTGYGGVQSADTFAHKIGIASGYAAADIINAGVSSDTSAGVLARLATDAIAHAPDVCVVCIGVNDWATGVTLATFKASLISIVEQLQASSIKVVVFTGNMNRGTAAEFSAYGAFIDATKEVAFLKGCPLIDMYSRMCVEAMIGAHTALYSDVIHLSVAGHAYWAAFAAKPWHAGFFVADPLPEPEPEPEPEPRDLCLAMADLLLATVHPELTPAIAAERLKYQ